MRCFMFYRVMQDKFSVIIDARQRVVGFVQDNRFCQFNGNLKCDPAYRNGLSSLELEQIAESMQKPAVTRKIKL